MLPTHERCVVHNHPTGLASSRATRDLPAQKRRSDYGAGELAFAAFMYITLTPSLLLENFSVNDLFRHRIGQLSGSAGRGLLLGFISSCFSSLTCERRKASTCIPRFILQFNSY